MVAPKYRSRTMRRVKVKTPGGRTVTHYRRRRPARASCPETGEVLPGVPHLLPTHLRKLPKSSRRPERPYGGVLSSKAMRVTMKQLARRGDSAAGEGAILTVGAIAVKIAGRDAGKRCVIVDFADKGLVLVDGETRRRKVNPSHLEFTGETVSLAQGANTAAVVKAVDALGFVMKEKKSRSPAPRPRKVRKSRDKSSEPAPVKKKESASQAKKKAAKKKKTASRKKTE